MWTSDIVPRVVSTRVVLYLTIDFFSFARQFSLYHGDLLGISIWMHSFFSFVTWQTSSHIGDSELTLLLVVNYELNLQNNPRWAIQVETFFQCMWRLLLFLPIVLLSMHWKCLWLKILDTRIWCLKNYYKSHLMRNNIKQNGEVW